MISLQQAHQKIEEISPLQASLYGLEESLGLICGEDVYARADCPSVDSSLKDGFAVIAEDVRDASPENPVLLTVAGTRVAGDEEKQLRLDRGKAVRIMTGASIPHGATSVLASEFVRSEGPRIMAVADADRGRNILRRGSDIGRGSRVAAKGTRLTPSRLGLLAAAGVSEVSCFRRPVVAVVATGSELVWPGEEINEGEVAASNMLTAKGELKQLGVDAEVFLLRDNLETLEVQFRELVDRVDVLITCGGVLDGDKDLTMKAMERLGMEKIFHRVRIGPGKGACMGWIGKTLVFNLPGGPPSNHVSLVLLALPGIRKRMGHKRCTTPKTVVQATEELFGQKDWTQLFYSRIKNVDGRLVASSLSGVGRLETLAAANALLILPEGERKIVPGSCIDAWVYGAITAD